MSNEFQLSYLNDEDRLSAYQAITKGCMHLWSKNKLQLDRFKSIIDTFIRLGQDDPLFLAHFTSYVIQNLDSKDLKVVATFANSLSDADGTPFIESEKDGKVYNSKYKKPNLRVISQSAIQYLEPKMVLRVMELANLKMAFGSKYRLGTHFARSLKKAIKKYIKYREQNLQMVKGIQKAGLRKVLMNLYRGSRIAPTKEVAEILRWDQKKGEKIIKKKALSFDNMKDLDIAKKIRDEKISPIVALGVLPEKISPVIALSILEQTTGNQAVILHSLFEKQGLLRNKDVKKLFEEKLSYAKDAINRVERINSNISTDVKRAMEKAKSATRKKEMGDIGKIFMHIDISSSMQNAIEFAKEKGAIVAECVNNPEENFFWGAFNKKGFIIDKPKEFTKGAFMEKLYGLKATGMTNCMACYQEARKLGCDIDVFVTDQGHNEGSIQSYIDKYGKPNAVVIVHFSNYSIPKGEQGSLYQTFIDNNVPVAILDPDILTESALVTQAIKTAMVGAVAIIDEIMETPLLTLPKWWNAISA